jgi:hypothetical protein
MCLLFKMVNIAMLYMIFFSQKSETRGLLAGMRMTSKSLAMFLTFVFSLVLSGPAFSGMDCINHMAHGHMGMGMSHAAGSGASQTSHAGHTNHSGHTSHGEAQLSSVSLLQMMIPGECCFQTDCVSTPSASAKIRYNDFELIALASRSPVVPVIESSAYPAMELFMQYQVQQGPPLLLASAYKAHLAKTSRQLT